MGKQRENFTPSPSCNRFSHVKMHCHRFISKPLLYRREKCLYQEENPFDLEDVHVLQQVFGGLAVKSVGEDEDKDDDRVDEEEEPHEEEVDAVEDALPVSGRLVLLQSH